MGATDEARRGAEGEVVVGAPDLTPTAGAKALRPRRGGAPTTIVCCVVGCCGRS